MNAIRITVVASAVVFAGLMPMGLRAASDGLPPLQVDSSWSTADRANYVSAPDAKEVVLATLDATLFSYDVKEFTFQYCTPGFLLLLK